MPKRSPWILLQLPGEPVPSPLARSGSPRKNLVAAADAAAGRCGFEASCLVSGHRHDEPLTPTLQVHSVSLGLASHGGAARAIRIGRPSIPSEGNSCSFGAPPRPHGSPSAPSLSPSASTPSNPSSPPAGSSRIRNPKSPPSSGRIEPNGKSLGVASHAKIPYCIMCKPGGWGVEGRAKAGRARARADRRGYRPAADARRVTVGGPRRGPRARAVPGRVLPDPGQGARATQDGRPTRRRWGGRSESLTWKGELRASSGRHNRCRSRKRPQAPGQSTGAARAGVCARGRGRGWAAGSLPPNHRRPRRASRKGWGLLRVGRRRITKLVHPAAGRRAS
jgi:hypothetical protein